MRKLIDLLPEEMKADYVKEILRVIQIELDEFNNYLDETNKELYITTAEKKLPSWAKIAGIKDNEDLDIDIRRSNILAMLKGREITTPLVIKSIVESYTNGTCEVTEIFNGYHFEIKLISTIGVPKKIDEIKKIINRLKPAHLNYTFKFKYITWGEFMKFGKPIKWYKERGYTWKDVKEGRHLEDGGD